MNTKTNIYWVFCCSFLLFASSGFTYSQEDWPQWRGPHLNGVSKNTELPTEWSLEKNILWKTDLPAWSGSTPVITGDRIFLVTPSKSDPATQQDSANRNANQGGRSQRGGGGKDRTDKTKQADRSNQEKGGNSRRGRSRRRGGGGMRGPASPGGKELMLLCLSKTDGSILWRTKLEEGNRKWGKQNSSSPSPVTDGQHVWTLTGNGQLSAFDMQGEQQWTKNLQQEYGDFGLGWGYASSPLLHDGKIIVEVLHGRRTDDPSYVAAFDSVSGDEIWRQERPTDAPNESPDAYTTPMVLVHDGKTQIIISGGDYVTGHDLDTGEEIWRSAGLNPNRAPNYRVVGSPLITENLIIAPTRKRPITAIKPGGKGNVTETHIAWQFNGSGGPDVPTPSTDGEFLYLVDDAGKVTCLKLDTGDVVWAERTHEGIVSSSPLLADGKIYITNEKAITTVIKAGDSFEKIATNELDGSYTLSSIAVSGSNLYLRTANALYCIGSAIGSADQ